MDGATNRIAEKVQELSDLELAALLCLIAGEHCIIEAEPDLVDAVGEELQLVSLESRIDRLHKLTDSDMRRCIWALLCGT